MAIGVVFWPFLVIGNLTINNLKTFGKWSDFKNFYTQLSPKRAIMEAELRAGGKERKMIGRFFRAQHKGISFEEMKTYRSQHGDERLDGIAASNTPDGLDGGSRFGGAYDAMDSDDEIVIFDGRVIGELYDGYIVEPIRELARFTVAEWDQKIEDGSAWDWEVML